VNNRNNKESDIFGIRNGSSSTLSNSGRQNRKNAKSIDDYDNSPKQRRPSNVPPHMRSQINICVTEGNNNMNASFDDKLPQFGKNNETIGKSLKKQRNSSMDNNAANYERLICNNCLNGQLATVKRLKNNEGKDENHIGKLEENNKFVDNMNEYRKNAISKKIKNRENMAQLASKMVNNKMDEKTALQLSNENKVFHLYKGTMDHAQRKAIVKNMAAENYQERNMEKFINANKTEKDRYYEKYVENQNVQPMMNNIGSTTRETNRQDYMNELMQQSQMKESKAERQKIMDRNKGLESVLLYKNKFDQVEKEKKEKEEKLKDEFIKENKKLLDKKIRKKEVHQGMEQHQEREVISKNNDDLEREIQKSHLKKSLQKSELVDGLNKQLTEKNNKYRSISQKKIESTGFTGNSGNHECKFPCYKCNKTYPKNMLNNNNGIFK